MIEETMALPLQFPCKEANLLERPGFAVNLLEILRALPLRPACKVTRCRWEMSPERRQQSLCAIAALGTEQTSRISEQQEHRSDASFRAIDFKL
jgi:hypothetical protein